MKVLVIGGTGTVGSEVVRQLLAEGEKPAVLTRSAEHAKKLPEGVRGIIGDLADPPSLPRIFEGAQNVFLLNAVSPTELHEGLLAVNGAKAAGVKKLVYLSVQNADGAPHVPHFGAKIVIEEAIKRSGIPYTILRPNNFYQNDYWFKDAITKYHVYPQPLGDVGLSRVDVRDIACCAVNALTKSGFEGQSVTLAGPTLLNGNGVAEILSRHFATKITYAGNDLNAWENQVRTMMPAWIVYDMKLMYRFFHENGLIASTADLAKQKRLLGRDPLTYDAFCAELKSQWK